MVYQGSRQDFFRASNLFFHPGSGELLRADLYNDRWTGDSVVHWIGAIHYGAFASWPGKMLWVIGSIGVSVSTLTGVWIFSAKGRTKRLRGG